MRTPQLAESPIPCAHAGRVAATERAYCLSRLDELAAVPESEWGASKEAELWHHRHSLDPRFANQCAKHFAREGPSPLAYTEPQLRGVCEDGLTAAAGWRQILFARKRLPPKVGNHMILPSSVVASVTAHTRLELPAPVVVAIVKPSINGDVTATTTCGHLSAGSGEGGRTSSLSSLSGPDVLTAAWECRAANYVLLRAYMHTTHQPPAVALLYGPVKGGTVTAATQALSAVVYNQADADWVEVASLHLKTPGAYDESNVRMLLPARFTGMLTEDRGVPLDADGEGFQAIVYKGGTPVGAYAGRITPPSGGKYFYIYGAELVRVARALVLEERRRLVGMSVRKGGRAGLVVALLYGPPAP